MHVSHVDIIGRFGLRKAVAYIYIYTYIHLYSYISVEGPVQEILRRFPSSRSLWQVSVRDLCARSLYKVSVKRPLGKILVRDP